MSKSRKPDINVDTNLPISSKSLIGTSKPQEAFYYYIKQIDPTAINRDKVEGKEVDIHLPSLNIGIEYDGEYSHSGEKAKEREKKKNDTLKKVGLKLIRVKEVSGKSSRVHCSNIDGIQIFTYSKCNNYRYLDKVIIEVITTIFGTCPIIVDRKADNIKILELSHQVALEKSIATVYPDIAKQWHPTENGNLKPSMFSPGSVDEVWWQCDKYSDHKWKAAVYSRVAGNGCPICAGKIVLAGFNDLASQCPELAEEWHPTKNGGLKPSEVTSGSNKKVWWRCKLGHEYKAQINDRVRGNNCPVCSGKKVLVGYNDLENKCPDLAKEWHPTKNGDLKPSGFTSGSNKKVWWRCKLGHEWEASIDSRALNGKGCPYCAGQKILPGFNDLQTRCPELAQQWHPTKNGILRPLDVMPKSNKKVWWVCGRGHEWQAEIYSRAAGNGCPYCAGKKAWEGFNDLQTINPELARQWHPTKNGNLKPSEVTSGSNKKVWWICELGHEWEASIDSRALNGKGCPYCAGQKILPGFNDLQTRCPELAQQWHPTKNGNLKPSEVMSYTHKKVWWICEMGHEWDASVYSRVAGNGCPYCAGKRVLAGYNDLESQYPEIAEEWHPTRNNNLKPSDVMPGSDKIVWWRCKNNPDHEWQARISSRKSGNGCPECAKLNRKNKPKN